MHLLISLAGPALAAGALLALVHGVVCGCKAVASRRTRRLSLR